MKNKTVGALVTCVAIAVAQIPIAFAQGGQNQDRPMQDRQMQNRQMPDQKMQRDDMKMKNMMKMQMQTIDENNDGSVSRAEFMQAHERMFERMDKNSDGMLSNDELDMGMTKTKGPKKNQ